MSEQVKKLIVTLNDEKMDIPAEERAALWDSLLDQFRQNITETNIVESMKIENHPAISKTVEVPASFEQAFRAVAAPNFLVDEYHELETADNKFPRHNPGWGWEV